MRKLNLVLLTAIAGLIMLCITAVKAQNMNNYITLNVQQGEWISLSFATGTANTAVKVVSGTTDTTFYVNRDWTDDISYYAQSDTMIVYGDVRSFSCANNGTKIIGLNASNNNTSLKELYCDRNSLSTLDVSGFTAILALSCFDNKLSSLNLSGLATLQFLACNKNSISSLDISGLTALSYLACEGNQLSACGLDSLFHQLPIRPKYSKGEIYIKDGTETNPGTSSCRDTIATNKFWDVLDFNGGHENSIPIKNTTYACPYFTGIKEIKQDNIIARLYPNPVSGMLYIESSAEVNRIEIYDVLGCRQLIATYSNKIDCSTLSAGIYILKLTTSQGNLIKKFVKE
ncbi:MAG: T9SS type A sorting domain-containing protein [Bacteroidales bacterium]|jgi:hypothetical protein|nr:T9SS type A sorting domain-containing protein [Bacteroidales bacterium]